MIVRVVHLTGNTAWGSRIEPYELKDGERVLSANYWRASGNHEQLDLIIEGPNPPESEDSEP